MKGERKSKHSLMSIFMAAAGLVLVSRLFVLTVAEAGKWRSAVEDMSVRAVYETAPRGDILDRNGDIIATSRKVYSVEMNGTDEEPLETAAAVMTLLEEAGEDVEVTLDEVRQAVEDGRCNAYTPLTLSEDVSEETAGLIEKGGYAGITVAVDHVREYPNGALASHILGYMGRITAGEEEEFVDERGYRKDALIGKDGVEKVYEEQLKGCDGVTRFRVDASGNVEDVISESKAEKGQDLTLTIDARLQKVTEDALEQAVVKASEGGTFESDYGEVIMSYAENAASGAAVALDVDTGEVLAMASYPDFDPNDFATGISEEKWEALQQENPYDPMSPAPLYNTATMTAVQPGSAFKPVTALAAMSCGLDEKRYLYDDGAVTLGGRSYGCSLWNDTGQTHGYVSLKEAMKVSCNYYFYDIASGEDLASGKGLGYDETMDNDMITKYAKMLGLGEKTGIEISESAGSTPSEKLKAEGIKNSLRNYLLAEEESYFIKSTLKNRKKTRKNIEKIVKLADKDLTLDEIIGKLTKENFIRKDKADELASVCKYTYFGQMEWTKGDTFNIAIGQGDNAYTTLQMANYMASLANGGSRNDVTLTAGEKAVGKRSEMIETVDEDDVKCVIEAMTGVTEDQDGSLYSQFASFPYTVAAKTGTAQRAGKKSDEDEREYLKRHLHLIASDVTMEQVEEEAERLKDEYPDIYEEDSAALRRAVINESGMEITSEDIDRYKEDYDSFAWTVALAPADEPQIAVAVMLVQGKTSSNAAPVAREIIGKYGEILEWEKSS